MPHHLFQGRGQRPAPWRCSYRWRLTDTQNEWRFLVELALKRGSRNVTEAVSRRFKSEFSQRVLDTVRLRFASSHSWSTLTGIVTYLAWSDLFSGLCGCLQAVLDQHWFNVLLILFHLFTPLSFLLELCPKSLPHSFIHDSSFGFFHLLDRV